LISGFVGWDGVTDLGLTERGLIDFQAQELIDVVLSEETVGYVGSLTQYPISAPMKVRCRCLNHGSDSHRLVERR
jgi:adenine deaminase